MKLMNDRKRKSSISAETCLEKFVKTHQVELNFWRFSIICNHCVPGGGGGSAAAGGSRRVIGRRHQQQCQAKQCELQT